MPFMLPPFPFSLPFSHTLPPFPHPSPSCFSLPFFALSADAPLSCLSGVCIRCTCNNCSLAPLPLHTCTIPLKSILYTDCKHK